MSFRLGARRVGRGGLTLRTAMPAMTSMAHGSRRRAARAVFELHSRRRPPHSVSDPAAARSELLRRRGQSATIAPRTERFHARRRASNVGGCRVTVGCPVGETGVVRPAQQDEGGVVVGSAVLVLGSQLFGLIRSQESGRQADSALPGVWPDQGGVTASSFWPTSEPSAQGSVRQPDGDEDEHGMHPLGGPIDLGDRSDDPPRRASSCPHRPVRG